mgnify:CR=1 FL=1
MKLSLSRSAQKDLDRLDDDTTLRVSAKLYTLGNNPYQRGFEKLSGNKGYRIRIGDYRVVYLIDKKSKEVTIIKVKHRREVYR